ncbi:MAG: response regulator transcription factor [Deltaproteobacteria bacterium]|nr:MAG: response regulator transcription factor [Deltaproteobacteria bacterium]
MSVKLVLVDDHALFREGLRALISTQPDLRIVGEASAAPEAHPILEQTQPDVLLLDIVLPRVSGISVAREVLRRHPRQRILMLTMLTDDEHVAQALAAGVTGYSSKYVCAKELFSAIRMVARGETYLAPGISRDVPTDYLRKQDEKRLPDTPLLSLTAREREIFELVVNGLSTTKIAAQLSISARTVETHRGRIIRKLGVHSATDLVRLAARLGLFGF